jgi:hypothetical protein
MVVQKSVAVRNAMLDAQETVIGVSAKVQLFTGAQPANCAAASSGTLLATFALAADWAGNAAAGVKTFTGTPVATTGLAAGSVGHYRIFDNAGTTCHDQGTVTATGGGGDATMDNPVVAASQALNLTSWSWTAPHP